mmetsp:Transcript_2759/g.5173  ORF Transcript_2759/g.5173 Transcript_2759/m.5173 type:complete len:271 (-) Transcript_2759:691-1503(-)
MMSVNSHIIPSPPNIPRYGGIPVRNLKRGTKQSAASPQPNTSLPLGAISDWASGPAGGSSPWNSFSIAPISANGTAMATSDGRISDSMMGTVVIWPPIHSIVVVTSPMGVHAPPALAAITTTAPSSLRSSPESPGRIFRRSEIMTMVEVRLSRMAERKKVTPPINHINFFLLRVVILLVMRLKPWWESTISTMVMAPIRKNRISPASARAPSSSWCTTPGPTSRLRMVHSATVITSPTPDLLTVNCSSKIIPQYPATKTQLSRMSGYMSI